MEFGGFGELIVEICEVIEYCVIDNSVMEMCN